MSFEITTAFVQQYHDAIDHAIQQRVAKLRGLVRVEPLNGKKGFYDRVEATDMVEKTTRHGDTPLIDTPHSRRMVRARTFQWADLVDDADVAKMLVDPSNTYMQAGLMAAQRRFDKLIIEAACATAYAGEDGATSVPLPAGQKVVVAASGLTLAKLRAARKLFRSNEVPEEWELYMTINAKGMDDLLGDSTITSADYNTVKALADGAINSFMGFTFVHTEKIQDDSNGDYQYFAWAKPGILLAVAQDIKTDVSKRSDKGNATQPFIELQAGATRMDEKLVVEIAVQH